MTLKLSPENTRIAMLTFLIKNFAAQKATTEILVTMLSSCKEEEALYIKEYNNRRQKFEDEIFNNLFETMNDVGIDQILEQ